MVKKYQNYLSYPIGLFLALLVFSVSLWVLGYDPISALVAIPTGALGSPNSISETLLRFIPLLLTAMAFTIALKARFMNLGVEGQLYIGALLAYLVGANIGIVPGFIAIPLIFILGFMALLVYLVCARRETVPGFIAIPLIFIVGFMAFLVYLVGARMEILPGFIGIPLIFIAGFMGGVLWLAIPLIMKTKRGVNEIFPTVVMNFIAMFIIAWLTTGLLKSPNPVFPGTPLLPESTWLPLIVSPYRLHYFVFLVVIIALFIYMTLYKTTIGYKIRAVGQNPRAAEHGGVNVTRVVITAGLLSGGIAGLTGMMEIFGVHHFLFRGFSPYFGFQGITVAALGNFHPIGVIFAAFFIAVLQFGGESMQRVAGIEVDINIIFIMQAVLVLTILIVQKWITTRNSS